MDTMTALLFSGLVLGVFVAALVRIRTIVRMRPVSASAHVLRAMDDRVLWTGAVAAIVVGLVYFPVRGVVPWWNWSWSDGIFHPVVASAAAGSVIGTVITLVLLAAFILMPLVVVGPVTRTLLVWTTRGAIHRRRQGRPPLQPLAMCVGAFAAGAPPGIAIPVGVCATTCGFVVRRSMTDTTPGDTIEWGGGHSKGSALEADLLLRAWRDLRPAERWAAARTAAVYGVLMFLTLLAQSLGWLLSIN